MTTAVHPRRTPFHWGIVIGLLAAGLCVVFFSMAAIAWTNLVFSQCYPGPPGHALNQGRTALLLVLLLVVAGWAIASVFIDRHRSLMWLVAVASSTPSALVVVTMWPAEAWQSCLF